MIQTNKLLPILTGIKQDKKLINESQPQLKLPSKKEARMESNFRLEPFIKANSDRFMLGLNPTLDIGRFSVGPYGVAAGSYDDPRIVDYGIRGSYDINPHMSISGDVSPEKFKVGLNYKFEDGRQKNSFCPNCPTPWHNNTFQFDSTYMANQIPLIMKAMVEGQPHHTSVSNQDWTTYPANYFSRNLEGLDFTGPMAKFINPYTERKGPYWIDGPYGQYDQGNRDKAREAAYNAWVKGDKQTKSYLTDDQINMLVQRYPQNNSSISYDQMLSVPDFKRFQAALKKSNKKKDGGIPKAQPGKQVGNIPVNITSNKTATVPNYRQMAIDNGISAADYDKNKDIIEGLLADVMQPGVYDPGFMARAKIAIARSKYPNIDQIIAKIDKATLAEGGATNIKQPITNQFGQHLFPGQITGIKGGNLNNNGDYVTPLTGEGMLHNLITINPYGASKLQKGEKLNYQPGNYQLEIPMAQFGGGQEDQISQLISAYAQLSGLDPQEIIQKLQSLPRDQQQQALQSIAQEVQQAMAQQQQQGAAGQQMGMAKEGGEPCFDCFDHYNPSPQAQDLEWYYKKAKGGSTYMMDDLYQDGKQTGNQTAVRDNTSTQSMNYQTYNLPHTGDNLFMGYNNVPTRYFPPTHYLGSPIWLQNVNPSGLFEETYNKVTYPGDTLTDNQLQYIARNNVTVNKNNELEYDVDRGKNSYEKGHVHYKMSEKDLKKLQDIKNQMTTWDIIKSNLSTGSHSLPFAIYPNNGSVNIVKSQGGETYLPYDRPGETRPNFMFKNGGQKRTTPEEYQKKLLIDLLNNQ